MKASLKLGAVVAVVCLCSCASDKAAKEETPARRSSTVEGGLEGAPAAALAPGGWVSLDERGAFGPHVVSHLDVMPDGSARCFRRHAKTGDVSKVLQVAAADQALLKDALEKSATFTAVAAARQGTIQDVGVTTLAVAGPDGKVITHVVDGQNTVEPTQGEVLGLLSAWLLRCVEAP